MYLQVIQELEARHHYVYAQILVEEHDTKRLLAYVQREPALIERYYPHLVDEYMVEVTGLFLEHIRSAAVRSSKRADYQGVCRIIRMLQKAGGENEAKDIIRELLDAYPRRPAFREELMKL